MIRQYRIDRFNGVELLVCECFRKHTWNQVENDAFFAWKEDQEKLRPNQVYLRSDFNQQLEDFMSRLTLSDESSFYGLKYPIPVYDNFPCIILRGPVVGNRIVSLQVEYVESVLAPEVCDEVRRFYQVMDSRHWRDMVSHQLERYGSLFGSEDD